MRICSFCSEIEEESIGNYFSQITFSGFENRIIWENKDFVIVPTIGCFIEGYILLLPKNHIMSFSEIDKTKWQDLREIVEKIQNTLNEAYGTKGVMYEHGSVKTCLKRGGACEDHAHMHFLPISISYSKIASKHFDLTEIEEISMLANWEQNEMSYLFFSDEDGKMYVCSVQDVVSQYFRQITAIDLNIGDVWRWQTMPFVENMQKTYLALKPIFNHFKLSNEINEQT